jgi:HipA N-terminal domain
MSDYRLSIFAGQALVGTLAFEPSDDGFSLSYAPQWAGSAQGNALSPHLPLQGTCSSLAIRRFI